MAARWITCVAALAAAWLTAGVASAGKLDDARQEVSGGGDSASSSGGSGGSGGWSVGDSSVGDAFGEALGDALVDAIVAYNEEVGQPRLPRYPYADRGAGYVLRVPDPDEDTPGKRWAARVDLGGAYLGDDVWRVRLGVEGTYWRVSLRSDTGSYLEPRAPDALYMGTANLYLAPVMRPHGLWRIGGGLAYMVDGRPPGSPDRTHALGGTGSTILDLFPTKHLVISMRADLGRLGAASTWMARGTIGLALRRVELRAGYEGRGVGSVRFDGPVIGVRLWF